MDSGKKDTLLYGAQKLSHSEQGKQEEPEEGIPDCGLRAEEGHGLLWTCPCQVWTP